MKLLWPINMTQKSLLVTKDLSHILQKPDLQKSHYKKQFYEASEFSKKPIIPLPNENFNSQLHCKQLF